MRDKEALKNECIVLAKFTNNPGQLMSYNMLDNLFKSSQKLFRSALLHMQTIVSSKSYEEIRVRVSLEVMKSTAVFKRAKNEVRILNEEVKHNESSFVPEKEEYEYEDFLKKSDSQSYLEYLAIKLLLLYSFNNEKAIEEATFKFCKSCVGDGYYPVDLDVHKHCDREWIWGILVVEEKVSVALESKMLRKEEEMQNRYGHLENHPTTKALEKAMLEQYQRVKLQALGKPKLEPLLRHLATEG